jgi:hypothetical protein
VATSGLETPISGSFDQLPHSSTSHLRAAIGHAPSFSPQHASRWWIIHLSTGLLAGRFPVDAPYGPITAFFCSQTLSALQPARFHRSDTQSQCLSARNIRSGSLKDIAGDNPSVRRNSRGNQRGTSALEPVRSASGRRCDETNHKATGLQVTARAGSYHRT